MFDTSKSAKEKGWFSRRHETSEANRIARDRRNTRVLMRKEAALAREEARAERTDEEQLAILHVRGFPLCREADRLRKKIVANG